MNQLCSKKLEIFSQIDSKTSQNFIKQRKVEKTMNFNEIFLNPDVIILLFSLFLIFEIEFDKKSFIYDRKSEYKRAGCFYFWV